VSAFAPVPLSGFSPAIRPRTHTMNAVLARDPVARALIRAPHAGIVAGRFVRPGAAIAAGDVIVHLAPEPATEVEATAVATPIGGLVLALAEVGTGVAFNAPLATVLGGFVAEVIPGPDMGAFDPADVVHATITCAGIRHPAEVVAVASLGNTRRVTLRVQDFANALASGADATVTLTIQPTAAMVEAEFAAKRSQWRYRYPPRGVAARELGLIPPRLDAGMTPPRASSAVSNPFIRARVRREAGAYAPIPCRKPAPQLSHRHVFALSPSGWAELAVATTAAQQGTIAVHVDAAGHRVREAAPEQAFALIAPVAGSCRLVRRFAPRDFVRAGEAIAVITVSPAVLDVQARYLAAPGDGSERRHLGNTLRRFGLREPELMMIDRITRPIPEITVHAAVDGLVEACAPDGPVAAGATLLSVQAANTDFLTLRLPLAAFAALPSCVNVRVRGAPPLATFAAPLIEVTIDASTGVARTRIPVPAGAIDAEMAGWIDLRLEDAASRHAAILIPQTCLAQVGRSCEALVQIGPGQLRPVSVATGLRCDGLIEITEGLVGDETVVDHLEDLAAEDDRVRALLLGFWQPSPRLHGTGDSGRPVNPLIA